VQNVHVFLGARHSQAERNIWATIALTLAMMVLEIGGGVAFGSLALVSDGFHMSTHAGALAIAALAYTLARRRADDPRFAFGTGKFGDLAGFSSALLLAMIALEIAWEAAERFFAPHPIAFAQAIPIAALGLAVNLASAWLLSRGGHHHHDHDHHGDHAHDDDHDHHHGHVSEHDNNMRAAILHVIADAAVSVLVIVGLSLAYVFGWSFLDPLAALAGAIVIASWSWQLLRDTGAVLLDMTPDARIGPSVRVALEAEGDGLVDWHLWRLGPGHFGAVACVETASAREVEHYRARIAALAPLSHLTVEIVRRKRGNARSRSVRAGAPAVRGERPSASCSAAP